MPAPRQLLNCASASLLLLAAVLVPVLPANAQSGAQVRGAFATAAVGIVDIHFDDTDNRAYYRKPVKATEVLSGRVKDAQPSVLARALDDQ